MDLDQTGFIKGRSITENFVYAMELIQCCHKRKTPTLVVKLEFAKAFHTVSWEALDTVMQRLHPHLAKMDAAHTTIISISGIV